MVKIQNAGNSNDWVRLQSNGNSNSLLMRMQSGAATLGGSLAVS